MNATYQTTARLRSDLPANEVTSARRREYQQPAFSTPASPGPESASASFASVADRAPLRLLRPQRPSTSASRASTLRRVLGRASVSASPAGSSLATIFELEQTQAPFRSTAWDWITVALCAPTP